MGLRARFAIPVALLCGAAVFAIAFFVLYSVSSAALMAIGVAAALCVVSAGAVWLILDDRSARQVQIDAYSTETEQKLRQAQQRLKEIGSYKGKIKDPATAELVQQIGVDTRALFDRVRERSPNTMQSTVVIVSGHLDSIAAVVRQYVDIQDHPRYHDNAEQLLRDGSAALKSFEEFLLNSIKLIEKGDTLGYTTTLKQLEATRYAVIS